MTTPDQLPSNVIHIGGQSVFVQFYTVTRKAGEAPLTCGTFTLVGPDGTLTLDALVGPQGIPGEPSPIIRPQWGSPITEVEDLPDVATLDESDDGRAWYIDGQWHVYSDDIDDYRVVQGSIPGPPGVTPAISVSAELVDKGSPPVFGDIDVAQSGTTSAPHFHIEVPAVPGPEGPAGAIEAAADYDDEGINSEIGDFLVKKSETKWGPGRPDIWVPKQHTIPHADFTSYDGSSGRVMIAQRSIPARDYDYFLDVAGHVVLKRKALSSAQFQVEVRVGLTGVGTGESEPLFGLAPYDPWFLSLDQKILMSILPHYSDPGSPMRSVSPEGSVGRITAGDAVTVYVFIGKIGGAGGYIFNNADDAQLRILELPVL